MDQSTLHKGRGAQINTFNQFHKHQLDKAEDTGIDEWEERAAPTVYIEEYAKTLVNKVDSPDLHFDYSMNPYSGCEHGCIYCYARNAHEYHGFSAGIDFESKIIVRRNAPQLLHDFLMRPSWEPAPIMLSGNTDCYQPAEQTYRLTRQLLEVCLRFKQPVNIITKNAGVLKDLDVISELARLKLVSIVLTITSLDEKIRRVMEPRTTTAKQKFETMRQLAEAGIRVGVMIGPVIPGLTDHEISSILEKASHNGASFSAYTFIRLNGVLPLIFHDWLLRQFPDRAGKIWHLIEQSHGGKVNDTRWGMRMKGEGPVATMIAQQFKKFSARFGLNGTNWHPDTSQFCRPGEQLKLF
ncbi:PA0069 family radical SAM protein [Pollutibacter soli]|uniref:PA0069 family radical SAM protein n=1 Tax=Pollutibacter soli TaxID=3034157 RepID=UPI0030134D10